MLQLSAGDFQRAMDHMRDVHDRATRYSRTGEDVIGAAGAQVLSGVAAFGYGFAEARFGPLKAGPLPADLLIGSALHGGALFGLFGKHGGMGHSLGQGFLDGFFHRLGLGLGYSQGLAANPPRAPINIADPKSAFHIGGSYGAPGSTPTGRGPVTEAEIVALVSKAR